MYSHSCVDGFLGIDLEIVLFCFKTREQIQKIDLLVSPEFTIFWLNTKTQPMIYVTSGTLLSVLSILTTARFMF